MISHIKISQAIPEPVIQAMRHIEQYGHVVWLVGGCVRDLMRGQHPEDFDLATDATPDEVALMFEQHVLTGYAHGTVTVFWQHMPLEITTFRSEDAYIDGRRPSQVSYHRQIEHDLARRDFTINSMAYHPENGLLDPFDGLDDLRNNRLRCVGDPYQRFIEDSLRILRALRFVVSLNLNATPELLQAASRLAPRITNLSAERISSELKKIIGSPYPLQMDAFAGTGVLAAAVYKLFQQTVDDRKLNLRLQSFLCRNWQKIQLVPLLLLAIQLETTWDQQTAGKPEPECHGPGDCGIKERLAFWSDREAQHELKILLIRNSRISKAEAAASCAQLLWVSLRSLMPAARPLDARQQRILLRQLAYRYRLSAAETVRLASAAQQLLQQLQPEIAQDPPLESLLCDPYPVLLLHSTQLAVSGRDLLDLGLEEGPLIQRVLERTLSYAVSNPDDCSRERLLQVCRQIIIPQLYQSSADAR